MTSSVLIPIRCASEHCNNITWFEYKERGMYFFYFNPEYYDKLRMRINRSKLDIQKEIVKNIRCRICNEEMMAFVMRKSSAMKFEKLMDENVTMVLPGENRIPGEETEELVAGKPVPTKPDFLEIETELRVDQVYSDLIDEINVCVHSEAYSSALVMLRKLLETLIVDLLRFKYDPLDRQDMYFDQTSKFFLPLRILVNRFEEISNEYTSYGFKKDHLAAIKGFRKKGNDAAHNIVDFVTHKEMNSYRKNANHAVVILLRLNGIKRGILNK